MQFEFTDFNGSHDYFEGKGAKCWEEIKNIISEMPIFLQASQQKGIEGNAIFDPKATNGYLHRSMRPYGWEEVRVPKSLEKFGMHWDGGKDGILAEWQFSNYPFLWNNVIRTEAMYKSKYNIPKFGKVKGLIIVTKGGVFPASNSTLYYEQARAQLSVVTKLKAFEVPIRLVGLFLPANVKKIEAVWSGYLSRYGREAHETSIQGFSVTWRKIKENEPGRVRFSKL